MKEYTIEEIRSYYTIGCMIVVKNGNIERITKDVEGERYYALYNKECPSAEQS